MKAQKVKKPNLTELEQKRLLAQLILTSENEEGIFKTTNKKVKNLAKKFKINSSTVWRIWSRAKKSFSDVSVGFLDVLS